MITLFENKIWWNEGVTQRGYWSVYYESKRIGKDMQYRFHWKFWLHEKAYFGFKILMPIDLGGTRVATVTVKNDTLQTVGWSNEGTTNWYTIKDALDTNISLKLWVYKSSVSPAYLFSTYEQGGGGLPIVTPGMTVTQSLASKTYNSIKMDWATSEIADKIAYSIDGGSTWNWITLSSEGTSGDYLIEGLSPNTTYKIRTRARRKDTGIDTNYTATLDIATYKTPSTPSDVSFGNVQPFSCTVYCTSSDTSNTSAYEYVLCDANKKVISTLQSNASYYNFTGLSEETTYYVKCRVQSKDSGTWSGYKEASFMTPADQSKGYINTNGTWRLGKVFINDNGTWKKAKKTYIKKDGGWVISKNPQ